MKKHIVFGILAHVDAGKTTFSEGCLFASGKIKKRGRVDNKDTCLDNYAPERERGITIFSKQAEFSYGEKSFTLLDTPGHMDFQAEMERVLGVLDYAILLISASEGVRPYTKTVWNLLKKENIPTFLFINKMDATEKTKEEILKEIHENLTSSALLLPESLSFSEENEEMLESIAVLEERLMEEFLETGAISKNEIRRLIQNRILFPCFFGSALRYEGVEECLKAFADYTEVPEHEEGFGAKVFKISREFDGTRLAHLKVTGGRISVKEKIGEEKVNQIRIYSGEKYEVRHFAEAGEVCVISGLQNVYVGDGLGSEQHKTRKCRSLQVMSYTLLLPEETDAVAFFPKIRELAEEIPELNVRFDEEKKEIALALVGEVQKEVLVYLIRQKYGVEVGFGEGRILYKETLAEAVQGFGHFEPLKHYAEVHLLLTPTKRGSGISVYSDLSEDFLAGNLQKQILHFLTEREHKGVLTGSPITDMEIRLIKGKAHQKHTDGGDFKEAAYRAVRNGLMRGKSILLEPVYSFRLELPERAIGRAMADLSTMKAEFGAPEVEKEMAVITGKVPVSQVKDYMLTLRSYTGGEGKIHLEVEGYAPCHNEEEVIGMGGYYPEADTEHTADSVFCSHGAGFVVPWDEVENYLHLSIEEEKKEEKEDVSFLRYATERERQTGKSGEQAFLGTEEIDKLLCQAVNSNKKKEAESTRNRWKKKKITADLKSYYTKREAIFGQSKEEYLLVDGYNIIFAWEELKKLAEINIDSARDRLIELLSNYQGFKGMKLILVFDAYKVRGGREHILKQGGIDIVYTREAETADQYIAKTSKVLGKEAKVSVATSDSLVQMIIFGSGAIRISARDFWEEVRFSLEQIRENLE